MRQTGLELSVSTVVTMEIAIGLDVTNFPATFFTDNLLPPTKICKIGWRRGRLREYARRDCWAGRSEKIVNEVFITSLPSFPTITFSTSNNYNNNNAKINSYTILKP